MTWTIQTKRSMAQGRPDIRESHCRETWVEVDAFVRDILITNDYKLHKIKIVRITYKETTE